MSLPDAFQGPARQCARRMWKSFSAFFVPIVHLLQVTNKLPVAYPWSTPTAVEVVANYTRGMVLFGRPGSRWIPFEWRSFPNRAVITRETAKVPKRLRRYRRHTELETRFNEDFETIIQQCSEERGGWLTPELIDIYLEVHKLGFTATVGTYRGDQLVGGLWGLAVGRVFSVYSLFHRENQAGAFAMAALTDNVAKDGYWSVVDCGAITANTVRYGATEIPEKQFCELVWDSLKSDRPPTAPDRC